MSPPTFIERAKAFFADPVANGYNLIPSYGATEPTGEQVLTVDKSKIEPKVWLASERTYLNWLRVSLLISSFALALFNSAPKGDKVAKGMGVVYAILAVGMLGYAWQMQNVRRRRILTSFSGSHDDMIGPMVVCVLIFAAVLVNFILRVNQREELRHEKSPKNPWITSFELVQHALVIPDSVKNMF